MSEGEVTVSPLSAAPAPCTPIPAPSRSIALRLLAAFAMIVSTPSTTLAQTPAEIRAFKTSTPIRIDGRLTEEAWASAAHITSFTQRELDEGEPGTERTEVAVLYDEGSLYVGFWGYDREPDRLVASKMQRDFSWGSEDNFEFVLDTFDDDRSGYLFVTNPNGARADATITDNGNLTNKDWDGVWYVATRVTSEGWFAEIRIPLSTLKYRTAAEQSWGINFERNIRRKHEQLLWTGWSRDADLEQVGRAGRLTGLFGLKGTRLVDVRPFAIAGVESRLGMDRATQRELGVDVSYLLTPTVKLNLTVNPDFAQVESDRAQVNLTRFSLFFPEKREFFLEGQSFFQFGLGRSVIPFFSRRVGLSRERTPVRIIGGLRLLGKTGGATVGGMSLQTASKGAEPSTNFTVLRWKQDIGSQSNIGFLSTSKIQPGRIATINGMDVRFDTRRLFGDKNFSAGLAIANSYTSDAPNQSGWAHRIFVSLPNDFVEYDAAWTRAAAEFNLEAGFQRRTAYQEFYTELQFNPRPDFIPWMRRMEFKPIDVNYYIDDRTHAMQSVFSEFRPLGFATRSGEFVEFNIQRLAENLTEDFEIEDGIVIPRDRYWFTRFEVQGETFSGRPVSTEFGLNWGDFYDGTRTESEARIEWRTGKYVSLSADAQRNRISLPAGDFTVNELGGRIDFAFSPALFGAVFGQWNDEDEEILLNFRVEWIPKPGTDFFFVVNQGTRTAMTPWESTGTTVSTKLIWRFAV
jgi:Domain of unknown function (DUF5916)